MRLRVGRRRQRSCLRARGVYAREPTATAALTCVHVCVRACVHSYATECVTVCVRVHAVGSEEVCVRVCGVPVRVCGRRCASARVCVLCGVCVRVK